MDSLHDPLSLEEFVRGCHPSQSVAPAHVSMTIHTLDSSSTSTDASETGPGSGGRHAPGTGTTVTGNANGHATHSADTRRDMSSGLLGNSPHFAFVGLPYMVSRMLIIIVYALVWVPVRYIRLY